MAKTKLMPFDQALELFEPVIGLEVHVELNTKTKMFSSAPNVFGSEPNTNLTSPETAIRNFVHGIGFQRDVMGADPATAWQLDVFGHDPQFPGMAADAGLTSS